jgi:hypothetical protein
MAIIPETVDHDEIARPQKAQRMMQHRRAGTGRDNGHGGADDAALNHRLDCTMDKSDVAEMTECCRLDPGEDR